MDHILVPYVDELLKKKLAFNLALGLWKYKTVFLYNHLNAFVSLHSYHMYVKRINISLKLNLNHV